MILWYYGSNTWVFSVNFVVLFRGGEPDQVFWPGSVPLLPPQLLPSRYTRCNGWSIFFHSSLNCTDTGNNYYWYHTWCTGYPSLIYGTTGILPYTGTGTIFWLREIITLRTDIRYPVLKRQYPAKMPASGSLIGQKPVPVCCRNNVRVHSKF
jgi:hypothetical protein